MTSNANVPLARFWGKTTNDPELFHPALYHMLDVGHVAQSLLGEQAGPRWKHVLTRALNADAERLNQWLPWIVALHDIGKISIPFQAQNAAQRQRLESEGVSLSRYSPAYKTLRHTLMGNMISVAWAKSLDARWGKVILAMIAGHHGEYQIPGKEHQRLLRRLNEPAEWDSWRQQARDVLREHLLLEEPERWPEPANLSAAIVALNGFTILCDWLGSDGEYFTPHPQTPIADYLLVSRRQAEERVRHARLFVSPVSHAPVAFVDLFGWSPRPLQTAIDLIPDDLLAQPTLTIIEAPTGEGKTEAALTLAHRIARRQGTDEMYIALPTTATSDAMYRRLQEHLWDRLHLSPDLIELVHGQAFLVKDDLRVTPLDNGDGETPPAPSWFEPKKKALLAPFGVGTIDQAELAALNVRHNALRLIGLAGKVVILDEVHAYDTYMTTIIARMLAWLSALGSSVILLSATLPAGRRRQLAEAYSGRSLEGDGSAPEEYPLLVTTDATGAADPYIVTPPATEPDRVVHLGTLHFEEEDWGGKARWLQEQVRDGGCACWIANTVGRAQMIYQALDKAGIDCVLLHSRFPLDERHRIEEAIVARFGKDGRRRPERAIVVGTQVLEQSLDIDFDVMVTDLAPIDLMLQRIGRLHRHRRPRPAGHDQPRVYVNYERDEAGEPRPGPDQFYGLYLLLKSWEVLVQKAADPGYLRLPDDYRPLIDAVYDEKPPAEGSPWREEWDKQDARDAKYEQEAEIRLANKPAADAPFYESSRVLFQEDEDSAGWMNAQTRFQERETITVIPLESIDEGHARIPDIDIFSLDRAASRKLQLRLLRRGIRLSAPDIVHALKAAERPALFTESALLKRCYPLWLEDGVARGAPLRLDPQLGLVIERGRTE